MRLRGIIVFYKRNVLCLLNYLFLCVMSTKKLNLTQGKHMFRYYVLFLINMSCFSNIVAQHMEQSFVIEGTIADSVSLEPLPGVAVIHVQTRKATTSDEAGHYLLKLPAGKNTIRFSLLGYVVRQIELNVSARISLNVSLVLDQKHLEEVTVTAQNWHRQVEGLNTGTFQLNRKEIGNLPVLLGETDYFKAIQLMPGIQTTGEGNAAIYVRGGAYDQNLVLLDEATVYNPTHLLGFYSVFNSDVISNVKVMKSGIPAQYGNRLSSVIEFSSKQDVPARTIFKGNIGMLSSRVGVDIPLCNHKVVVSLAARKTYLNTWLNMLKSTGVIQPRSILYKSGYDFYDLNGGVNATINAKNKISINFYNGKDIFQLNSDAVELSTDMRWGNTIGSVTWRRIFNEHLYNETSLVYSGYHLDMNLEQSQYSFNLISQINDYGFKNNWTMLLPGHKLNLGISTCHHTIVPNKSKASSDSSQLNLGSVNSYYSMESSIFVSDEVAFSDRLSFSLGLRYNLFNHLGDFTTYTHDDYGNVKDTLHYTRWENIKNYDNLDLRTSLRYLIQDNLSVKFSFNSNSQYLHLVNASSITFPTDFWISSSDKVKPQQGLQWAAGAFHFNKAFDIETSVEVYYKTFSHQVEFFKGILNAVDNSVFDENLIFGKGRAYGAEFLIRKTKGRITGWVGYTISKTEKSFAGIEDGHWFPAKYDRPHDLSLVVNYNTEKKWSFSAVFVYATGSRYTPVVGRYFVSNNVVNEYGNYNSARMPAYHRCDVSVTLLLKKTENRESKLIFSVYNLYNRRNPFFVYPEVSGNLLHYTLSVSAKEVSIFPILPSVGWEFRF